VVNNDAVKSDATWRMERKLSWRLRLLCSQGDGSWSVLRKCASGDMSHMLPKIRFFRIHFCHRQYWSQNCQIWWSNAG